MPLNGNLLSHLFYIFLDTVYMRGQWLFSVAQPIWNIWNVVFKTYKVTFFRLYRNADHFLSYVPLE